MTTALNGVTNYEIDYVVTVFRDIIHMTETTSLKTY